MTEAVPSTDEKTPPLAVFRLPLTEALLTPASDDVTEVLLTRHGQQDYRSAKDTRDRIDPPLSPTGRRQAESVGRALAAEPIAAVYSSNLRRAHETARAVAAHHDLEVTVLRDLREVEVHRDVPDGLSLEEAIEPTLLGGAASRFLRDRKWDAYPLCEPGAALRQRVVASIEGAIAAHRGKRIVVACHGGVINAYLAWVLGIAEDMFFRPGHASVSRLRARENQRIVLSLNEQYYLRADDAALVTW